MKVVMKHKEVLGLAKRTSNGTPHLRERMLVIDTHMYNIGLDLNLSQQLFHVTKTEIDYVKKRAIRRFRP